MKTLKNSLLAALGFVILVGVLVLSGILPQEAQSQAVKDVIVVNTTANPVPVSDADTVLPSQIVNLRSFNASTNNCPLSLGKQFVEVVPDDFSASPILSVPTNNVLIVTGLQLRVTGGSASSSLITLLRVTDGTFGRVAWESLLNTDANGAATIHTTLPPGFVVKSGTDLCFDPPPSEAAVMHLYGYFAPDM